MYKKLVTLGCSLAPRDAWPKFVANHFKITKENHTHYGFGGGDNMLTMKMWYEYFCCNDLSDTLVVWELTGLNRVSLIKRSDDNLNLHPEKQWQGNNDGSWFTFNTFFGGGTRFGVFSKSVPKDDVDRLTCLLDQEMVYSQLVTTIASIPCDTVVFRGWSGAVPNEFWSKSKPIFESNNVKVVPEPYTDWCLENDLQMLADGFHPHHTAAKKYARDILLKVIDKH